LRDSGALAFDQVPLLQIDGAKIVQTQAILRYLGRKRGLLGQTPQEAVCADMAVNAVLDARVPLITARFQDDPQAALVKFEEQTLPKFARQMTRLLRSCGGPYICGTHLTYSDVSLYEFIAYSRDEAPDAIALALAEHAPLSQHYEAMKAFPHLADYLSSPRRHPPPDEAFVRRVCVTLGMALPKYLREKDE